MNKQAMLRLNKPISNLNQEMVLCKNRSADKDINYICQGINYTQLFDFSRENGQGTSLSFNYLR